MILLYNTAKIVQTPRLNTNNMVYLLKDCQPDRDITWCGIFMAGHGHDPYGSRVFGLQTSHDIFIVLTCLKNINLLTFLVYYL